MRPAGKPNAMRHLRKIASDRSDVNIRPKHAYKSVAYWVCVSCNCHVTDRSVDKAIAQKALLFLTTFYIPFAQFLEPVSSSSLRYRKFFCIHNTCKLIMTQPILLVLFIGFMSHTLYI